MIPKHSKLIVPLIFQKFQPLPMQNKSATAQDLVKLLQAFDQTLALGKFNVLSTRLDTLTWQAQASGKELVDYTFRQALFLGLILIGSACGMVLISAVAFWSWKKKFA